MPGWITGIDYIDFDADPSTNSSARPNLAMRENKKYLGVLGQPANTVAGNVANQAIGTLAVPAVALNVVGTIALSNSLITANSFIFLTTRKVGTDAGTGRGPLAFVDALAAGSATIGIRAGGTAVPVSAWVVHYLIIN